MTVKANTSAVREPAQEGQGFLRGKRVGMVLFSYYPSDPRPRRAAEALSDAGMTVELICLKESSQDPKIEAHNGVDIRRVPIARRRGGILGYLYQYLAFLFASSCQKQIENNTNPYLRSFCCPLFADIIITLSC